MLSQGKIKNPVITAVPFLSLSPDAKSGSLGDTGVGSPPDAYSQFANAAKYPFIDSSSKLSISYTPWLNSIIRDIFFSNITYYNKISNRSAFGSSFTYFSFGHVEVFNKDGLHQYNLKPNEFSVDISYSLKLSDFFSMSISGRYIRSDINDKRSNPNFNVGNSFAIDIGAYYKSRTYKTKNGTNNFYFGTAISNLGPKINYIVTQNDNFDGDFLPTNLSLGGGFEHTTRFKDKFSIFLEANKLLVPTAYTDLNNPNKESENNVGVIEGLFASFADAPGGFKEELQESQIAIGSQYSFQDKFMLRGGYHYESPKKGNRRFISLGFGVNYQKYSFDFAYLISTSQIIDPLQNSLRFSLVYDISFGNKNNNN